MLRSFKKAQRKQYTFCPCQCPCLCMAWPAEQTCPSLSLVRVPIDKLVLYQKFQTHIVMFLFLYVPPDHSIFGICFPSDSFRCGSVEHVLGHFWHFIVSKKYWNIGLFLWCFALSNQSHWLLLEILFFLMEGHSGPFQPPRAHAPLLF